MLRTTVRTRLVSAGLAGLAGLALATPALADSEPHVAGELVRHSPAVPVGATAKVSSVATGNGRTIVTLHVTGLRPSTDYGAHAHVNPCGTTGAAAGPHFQHVVDPVQPSTDPEFANPRNEIWLDLTTNAAGNGHAKAVVDWQFTPEHTAASVILHERHTATGPHDSGTAGPRLACLTVPF